MNFRNLERSIKTYPSERGIFNVAFKTARDEFKLSVTNDPARRQKELALGNSYLGKTVPIMIVPGSEDLDKVLKGFFWQWSVDLREIFKLIPETQRLLRKIDRWRNKR